MKKRIILKSAAFASAAVLSPLLFSVSALGGLKDVAQPYLGTYECEQIFFGVSRSADSSLCHWGYRRYPAGEPEKVTT